MVDVASQTAIATSNGFMAFFFGDCLGAATAAAAALAGSPSRAAATAPRPRPLSSPPADEAADIALAAHSEKRRCEKTSGK